MRPTIILLSAAAFLAVGCTTSGTTTTTQVTAPSVAASPSNEVQSAASLTNSARARAGRSALTYNARLERAAQLHAEYMASTGRFSHTGRNGSTTRARVAAQGYQGCFWAENIAGGYTTGDQVVNAWMKSPKHRDNILDRRAREFGVGKAGSMWAAVYSGPC